jgi:hypothetical protein
MNADEFVALSRRYTLSTTPFAIADRAVET